jgi:TolB-like protein/Tfp pilus assembly protein PilF
MSEVVAPKHFNPKVPNELERIVMKALRKDREERYQTAKDLLVDLRQFEKQRAFAAELNRTGLISGDSKAKTEASIAVLPFLNISADPENDYFCDGLAEELLNALAKIDGLKVAARTSAFSFKGRNVDVSEIADALSVKTLLQGSVRKAGDRLRITVQLVNAEDGYQLWSERYDRDIRNIFDVQDEIAAEISATLRLKLSNSGKLVLTKRATENTQAYLLYLKGRFHQNKRTSQDIKEGIQYFSQAAEADVGYALAYAGLADSYLLLGIFGERSPTESMPQAKAAAARAMELDASLAEPCTSLAYVKAFYDWDWAGSEKQFIRALSLDPDYPLAFHYYSFYLAAMGRLDEAVTVERRAQRLDPVSLIISTNIGRYSYYARRYEEAIKQCRATLEIDPNYFPARITLGLAYEQQGLYEQAIAEFQNALDHSGGHMAMESLGHGYALAGKHIEALALIEELIDQSKRRYVSPHCLANIYLGLGEKDEAFNWLDKAFQDRAPWLVFLKVDPRFDNLRSEPRYAELLTRLGL